MVEDTYKYGKDNEGYQANITFAGLVKAYNIPDGAELVVNVESVGTSNKVTYMDGKKQVNDTDYTVSAVDIALESAGNNSYTLTGIEVGAKDKVAADTKIAFTVSIVDADGNVIKTSEKITVTINPSETTPVVPVEVPEITLPSATLTAKEGTDNKVATYSYTPVEEWELQNTTADITVSVGTVSVKDGIIALTLTDPYINTTETSTDVELTFKKGETTKKKTVTLKYTGDVKTATIALADGEDAAKDYSADGITYTLKEAAGWKFEAVAGGKVYSDLNCEKAVEGATVTIEGTTLTLNGVANPESTEDQIVYVGVVATKAGQNRTEVTTLTLKYKKTV